ncbi:hypothetical protein LJC30_04300 [Odoribacter sp. OttesenSCG-928-L07]|nr:hypothetical protein [Odoribacter sp. OttesenSCG-928-L07]
MVKRLFIFLFISQCGLMYGQVQKKDYTSFPIYGKNKDIAYSFIAEVGLSGGMRIDPGIDLTSDAFCESLVVIHNVVYKQNTLLGIGHGFGIRFFFYWGGNVFFNFRHYFGSNDEKFRPMIDASLGALIVKRSEFFNEKEDCFVVPTVSFGGGFRAGHFSLNAGLRYNLYKENPVYGSLYTQMLDLYLQFGVIF